MARHAWYGSVISVERDNLTAKQTEALVVLFDAGAIDNKHGESVYHLAHDKDGQQIRLHGRTLGNLYERGLFDGVYSLINEYWGNTKSWWLTPDGIDVARELKRGQGG